MPQAAAAAAAAALVASRPARAYRWKQGKPLLESKHPDEVETYAYPALAARLAGWMER